MGCPRCVTKCDRGKGGSKLVKNSVTYFMDGPKQAVTFSFSRIPPIGVSLKRNGNSLLMIKITLPCFLNFLLHYPISKDVELKYGRHVLRTHRVVGSHTIKYTFHSLKSSLFFTVPYAIFS